ncbi:MAG TPA: hypothetical protein VL326_09655 [Kofleriaceae bacterium]|jgi:hypothetical protein|nr:hypothetical protein [Kofleriaceae bacterium]
MRSLTTLVTTLVLAFSGVAAAQSNAGLPQNRQKQTEERYQTRNQLADVRLDARSTRAEIQLPYTGKRIDYLELRAGRGRFALDDVEVLFDDGTSIRTGDRGVVEPNQGRVINLPRHAGSVVGLVAHYRTLGRRWGGAELQVFAVPEHYDRNRWSRRWHGRF